MALKWLQPAHYPPAEPKEQRGLTEAEVDADYRRMQRRLGKEIDTDTAYAQTQAWVNRPVRKRS